MENRIKDVASHAWGRGSESPSLHQKIRRAVRRVCFFSRSRDSDRAAASRRALDALRLPCGRRCRSARAAAPLKTETGVSVLDEDGDTARPRRSAAPVRSPLPRKHSLNFRGKFA